MIPGCPGGPTRDSPSMPMSPFSPLSPFRPFSPRSPSTWRPETQDSRRSHVVRSWFSLSLISTDRFGTCLIVPGGPGSPCGPEKPGDEH